MSDQKTNRVRVYDCTIQDPAHIALRLEEFIEETGATVVYSCIPLTVAVPKKTKSIFSNPNQGPELEYHTRLVILYGL